MAISRFNKIILVVHFISKQALFGQKTPSLSYTGLTKQVFLSVSLKRRFGSIFDSALEQPTLL